MSDFMITYGGNMNELTLNVLNKLLRYGNKVPSRNGETLEFNPHTLVAQGNQGFVNPYCILNKRANNIFATIAETLWVFAGRNDSKTLERWLPRAGDYSDDGETWRAGYGPRIANYGNRVNQIETVLSKLQKDLTTRQAIVCLSDPVADKIDESKDYPCNLIVNFVVRNNKLNTHVYLRSNDVVFGVCINMFEWCFLSEYIANQMIIPFERYCHTATSLHLYDSHYDKAKKIVDNYLAMPLLSYETSTQFNVGLHPEVLKEQCNQIYEAALNKEQLGGRDYTYMSLKLKNYYLALKASDAIEEKDVTKLFELLKEIQGDNYLVLAILETAQRKTKIPLFERDEYKTLSEHKLMEYWLKHQFQLFMLPEKTITEIGEK